MAWLSSTKCRGTQKVIQKASWRPGAGCDTTPKQTQTDSSLVAIVAYGEWPGKDMIQGFRASGDPAPGWDRTKPGDKSKHTQKPILV